MEAVEVADLYRELHRSGVTIWIDGGWAVDAAVGRETRPHQDLDIAIEARQVPALKRVLELRGYAGVPQEGDSEWNFVLRDSKHHSIDVHVVTLDPKTGVYGVPAAGIAYPAGSLTGKGVIAGMTLRCVKAEILLQLKTSYPPRDVDRHDVAALCALLGKEVPETHASD